MANIYTFLFYFQSSSSQLFCRKEVMKFIWKSCGKRPSCRSATLLKRVTKIGLQHRRFPVNVWKIIGAAFYRKPFNGCVIGLNFPVQKTKNFKVIIQLTISGFFWTHFLSVFFNCPYFTDSTDLYFCLYTCRLYCLVYIELTHCPIKTLPNSLSLQVLRSLITLSLTSNSLIIHSSILNLDPINFEKPYNPFWGYWRRSSDWD